MTKIISGKATVSKKLTYKSDEYISREFAEWSKSLIPIIVWNITWKCNLNCKHCYAGFKGKELSTEDAKRIVEDLASFGVPLILFSGGEPLLREDLIEIATFAKSKGISCVLSTNGSLINEKNAEELAIFDYVGISIDGDKEVHDNFRGLKGAFDMALNGIKVLSEQNIPVGVRFTLTKYNFDKLPFVLGIVEEYGISRFCLYHLVPSGRADFSIDVDNNTRKKVIDYLIEKAFEFEEKKLSSEILTVDNPADGVYLYLKLKEIDEELSERVLRFLMYRGGDKTGIKIAAIDPEGYVHPNQFWWDYKLGNLKTESMRKIWIENNDELLYMLRNKEKYLRGKCGRCKFKNVCGGFRLRAYKAGDLFGPDPSCYIDEEIICH